MFDLVLKTPLSEWQITANILNLIKKRSIKNGKKSGMFQTEEKDCML